MEYIKLRNTDLTVSRLAIGGDPMGMHAWGETRERDLIDAVEAAIDQGVNYFDTADVYGLGTAERILAKGIGTKRDEVVIASKFGVRRTADNSATYYDNSPEWIRAACEGSLKRLGTDYIDIYQVHYLDGSTDFGLVVETLEDLKREGKIRYFGLSNVTMGSLSTVLPYAGRFATFQNQYSLAFRDLEGDILEISEKMEATPLTWGSLGQGILTGKYGRDTKMDPADKRSRNTFVNFHGERLQKNLDIVNAMREIGPCYGKEPPAIAIRFILDYLADSVVLVGVKRREQVLSNCEAFGWTLAERDLARLEQLSRIGGKTK